MEITLGSLFDGIAGFPLAGIRNGIVTLWGSEIEPFPIRVTQIRFPGMKHLGDITKINGAEIEPVDVITFGSPCQDLSVAGKRAGLAGERSGLFMEAIRIIREMRDANKLWNTNDVCTECSNGNYATDKSRISRNGICGSSGGDSNEKCNVRADKHIRPRFAVWENVPGAFSSNKGEDFRAVLEETARVADKTVAIPKPPKGKWSTAGTIMGDGWSIAWRVLDAQFWGVPQRRRRIFLVADFGGQSAPEVLFKRKGLSRHIAKSREAREGIASDAERSVDKAVTMLIREGCRGGGKGPLIQHDKSATLACNNSQTLFAPMLYESHPNDSRVTGPCEISPTISSRFGTGWNNTPLVQCFEPGAASRLGGYCYDNLCGTLRAEMGDNQPCVVTSGFCPEQSSKTRGIGYEEEISPTLRKDVTPAICMATKQLSQNIGFNVAMPIMANDYKEPQVVVYGICSDGSNSMKSDNPHSGIYEAETSRTLDQNGGSPACNQGGMAIVQKVYGADLSQKAEGICFKEEIATCVNTGTHGGHGNNVITYQKVTGPLMANTHPGSYTGQDAYSDMLVAGLDCRNGLENGDISGTIQKNGNSLNAIHPVRIGYTVRRLTPLECERLQDYPDGWTDISWVIKKQKKNGKESIHSYRSTDSGRYKACGNSVAVVCPEYVLEGIKEVIERGQIS
jgi:DNA (cytosine-5)-methyltransferase 1